MYLHEDLNRRRRPLMVTGWPLLTLWAQLGTIFPKARTLTGCSPVFTGIVPKVPENLPKWNLSVLNKLTKASFEPMKDTDLKHLTLKTAFLLALASCKCRSEIYAWVAKSLVTIPALTTIVDRQFKEDRTLCPVRALRYYLDQTKVLRGSPSLLFISFKKGHTSDLLHSLLG